MSSFADLVSHKSGNLEDLSYIVSNGNFGDKLYLQAGFCTSSPRVHDELKQCRPYDVSAEPVSFLQNVELSFTLDLY